MISDKDRSGWFGASDTHMVMGNWKTETFKKWWLEKLGLHKNTINTKAMKAGTAYEHKILDTIPGIFKDRQIIIPELHLRINLDGDTGDTIYEVKTHKADKPFKVSLSYFRQVNVQMFAAGIKNAYIVSYGLTEGDYANYFNEIETDRIQYHKIEYDDEFISAYLEKLKYLCECLEKGVMPK
jgi:hypothetical protein